MNDRVEDLRRFQSALRAAVETACRDWAFPPVPEAFFATFDARVPTEVQVAIGEGLRMGAISIDGYLFRIPGLVAGKGPYKLLGRGASSGRPQPHWEYYLQLAEYVRLIRRFDATGLRVGFEDELMDVRVRRDRELVWCVEVKEKPKKLDDLLAAFELYRHAVPFDAPDRGNDGLRKSKYLVRQRPPYLSLLALGARLDYEVDYPAQDAFELAPVDSPEYVERLLLAEVRRDGAER